MVIFKSLEEELYFKWLCERVDAARSYSKLMNLLYDIPFYYSIYLDRNRVSDALALQNDYILENRLDPNINYQLHTEEEISVLEVFVAMAIKVEISMMQDEEFGDRTAAWFWMMIENLDICQRNSSFNEDYIRWTVYRFMNREYEPDGTGSIVKLANNGTDVRGEQLWHQFCLYLSELMERGIV